MQAEATASSLITWPEILGSFRTFGHCDDGAIAEGYSVSIVGMLADRWTQFNRLVANAAVRSHLAAEGHEYTFAIVGDDGRFLGGCGINQINRIHKFGNLGYWVRTSATGRGVASEAVRQAAGFAFRNTDLVRLEIVCAVGNERGQRVAGRAGAVREGVLRRRLLLHGEPVDAVMYSLVRER